MVTGGPFAGKEGYLVAKQRCGIFLEVVARLINVGLLEREVAEAASALPNS